MEWVLSKIWMRDMRCAVLRVESCGKVAGKCRVSVRTRARAHAGLVEGLRLLLVVTEVTVVAKLASVRIKNKQKGCKSAAGVCPTSNSVLAFPLRKRSMVSIYV